MPYPSKTDRGAILAEAMRQVTLNGVDKLAMRSVAAALDLAPNALYRYFDNLASLQGALADESRLRLLDALQAAVTSEGPEATLRAIAYAYVQFAREHPELFSLTLRPGAVEAEDEPSHLKSWVFTRGHVAQLYGEERASEATVALWAFLHGITALEAAGVFGDIKPASSFEFGLQIWISAAPAPNERGST
ncbi:MAG: TetR/AcrR family transcriptional regulator [Burkholderiaceae bacterium]